MLSEERYLFFGDQSEKSVQETLLGHHSVFCIDRVRKLCGMSYYTTYKSNNEGTMLLWSFIRDCLQTR